MLPTMHMAFGGGGNALRPAFQLSFDDLGAGAVSTVEDMGAVSPTFTRATVAWTKLSTGLWTQVASGTARSFYTGFNTIAGSSATYGGYLAEGARTQLVTPNASIRDMTDASWVKVTMTTALTSTGIDGTANSATRLTATGASSTILQTLTAAASSRTYSVWLRRVTGTGVILIQQGATTLDVTADLNSTTYTRVELNASVLNSAFGILITDSGDALDADFNQFEAGTFASTPIATASTRNTDVLTYPTTGWLSATAGTMFSQWQVPSTASVTFAAFAISDGTTNEYFSNNTFGSNTQFAVVDGGVTQAAPGSAISANTTIKQAGAYAVNDFAQSTNGGTIGTDTSGTLPTVTTVNIGTLGGSGSSAYGPIRRCSYYNTRLANTYLVNLTA